MEITGRKERLNSYGLDGAKIGDVYGFELVKTNEKDGMFKYAFNIKKLP